MRVALHPVEICHSSSEDIQLAHFSLQFLVKAVESEDSILATELQHPSESLS